MKKIINIFLILSSFILLGISYIYAAINLVVSPIKYEIKAKTGTTITKTAKIKNPGDKTVHIIMGKSDFVPNGENGVPKFVRKSEMVFPDQQLSEWIEISTGAFDLAPGETKQISFDINIPENATPGGHYGAIFFKNNNSESSGGNKIGINVDYGVIILLEVEGEIVVDAEIKDPIINSETNENTNEENTNNENNETTNNESNEESIPQTYTSGGGGSRLIKDNCPNGDFSPSYYDKTCDAPATATSTGNIQENTNTGKIQKINIPPKKETNNSNLKNKQNQNNKNNNKEQKQENFKVDFTIPINNKGNTHIKPKGKIILKDENGKVIKGVGKEIVTNDKGAIVGERIVDYIPINDIGGVVIPGSSRNFKSEWKGFPYRDYDENGNPIIRYWTPTEYYSRKNIGKTRILMPWEQIKERTVQKNIIADFNIKYKGKNGEDIEYNSAKEFPVSYKEKYVAINWNILYIIFGLILSIIILFFLIRKKKKKCIKCGKTIEKDMKVCPYCGAKQKKKKK